MANPTQLDAVTSAFTAQSTAVRASVDRFIFGLWQSLGEYRDKQARDFVGQAVPVVQGAMQHMQSMTSAYLATVSGLTGGSSVPVATKPLTPADVRSGTPSSVVYTRPFEQVWRSLQQQQQAATDTGEAVATDWVANAIAQGLTRARSIAGTDVQLAKTTTFQQVLARSKGFSGYRRVLEGPHSCGLCVVASTRRYHKADLMPIHPGCDCSVEPIPTGSPLGDVVGPDRLAAAHAAVADRFGIDSTAAKDIGTTGLNYSDVLVTHTNSEIGPVLGIRGQHFTSH